VAMLPSLVGYVIVNGQVVPDFQRIIITESSKSHVVIS
jgi:hypothetical protein